MTASRDFTAFVQDLFAPLGGVSTRPMFGGAGIYSKGVMFGLVYGDTLYLKADADSRKDFEAKGSEPFAYQSAQGKPVSTSYWKLPDGLVDDADEAVKWAQTALAIAKAQKAATPPPSRRITLGAARRHR
ncbi:MAG: TfoX/Sxy family protein [Ferrovibrio sp.]